MQGSGPELGGQQRRVVYCVVPCELADRLHEPLRRHFADASSVEVVVEQRSGERRHDERRKFGSPKHTGTDRRRIRNASGRRIGERRAAVLDVDVAGLPRQARRHAEHLRFVERLEPASEHAEDLDTARLITRVQAGEADLFADIYLRYFDRVYHYLQVLIGDAHEAEDVTQQVFIRAYAALPRYERRDKPFRAWLFTIARNQALTSLSKLGRADVVEPDELSRQREAPAPPESSSALTWISDRELMLFVERLPLAQRQVLLLRYMMGMSNTEIAQTLGRTRDGVRQLHSRALAYLENRLRAVGREVPGRSREDSRIFLRQVHVLRARRYMLLPSR